MFIVCLPMAEYKPQEGRNYICLMHCSIFSVSITMSGTNRCSKMIHCMNESLRLLSSPTLLLCPTAHRKNLHSFSSRDFREPLKDLLLEIQPPTP